MNLYIYRTRVERVIDGDTVVVSIDLGCDVWLLNQHCRLSGINAPEKTGETKALGIASKEHLESLLKGHETVLVRTTYDKKCTFGRLLVELFVDGTSVNEEMIKGHFAERTNA